MRLQTMLFRSVITCACVSTALSFASRAPVPQAPPTKAVLFQQPLSFELNQGQADPQVKFLSRGPSHSLLLTAEHAVLHVGKASARTDVAMRLAGASTTATIEPLEPQPGQINYLLGNDPAKWHIGVPHYARVRYRDVYPGVDQVFYGNQQQLEYDLVVSPGADARAIAVRFEGAEKLQLTAQGSLLLDTADGQVEQSKPLVYQEIDGNRKLIDAAYVLKGANEVGFTVAAYDQAHALVIDPTLLFVTMGGEGDQVLDIASDEVGNVFVGGVTNGPGFLTSGAFQGTPGGGKEGFITKFGPGGTPMIFSTFFGGGRDDLINAIAVSGRAGNVYFTGETESTNVPTFNPFQPANGGGVDGFVGELNAAGNGLVFGSFLGGPGDDRAADVVLDPAGDIFITGAASLGFPMRNPFQGTFGGGPVDGFATLLNPAGTQIMSSTYLGGSGSDQATNAVYDASSGTWFLCAWSDSTNLQTTAGAYQPTNHGGIDMFLSRLNAQGTTLMMLTYFGGNQTDIPHGMAVGPTGILSVGGETSSTDLFTLNGFQPQYGGGKTDGFLTEFNPANPGPSFVTYSSFFGGNGDDAINAIAADALDDLLLGGQTTSQNLTVQNPEQATFGGGPSDCFFALLGRTPTGPRPVVRSFYGGPGNDAINAVLFDRPDPPRIRWMMAGHTVDGSGKDRAYLAPLLRAAGFDVE